MKQTPVKSVDSSTHSGNDARSQFFAAAMNMSWQLGLVVLVPVLGGYTLDQKFNTSPLLTIIGFIMAAIGISSVVWRQMKLYTPKSEAPIL